jgi:hypothetical protein
MLGIVIEQPNKGGDPKVIVMTGPDALAAVRLTDVVLAAINVHLPAVANVVDNSDEMLLTQFVQWMGFAVPVSVTRPPAAVIVVSPTLHEIVALPKFHVAPPTCAAVTDVAGRSQVAPRADGAPATTTITTAMTSPPTSLITDSFLTTGRGPPRSTAPEIRLPARDHGLGAHPRDC